jgi:hypothetical protein
LSRRPLRPRTCSNIPASTPIWDRPSEALRTSRRAPWR